LSTLFYWIKEKIYCTILNFKEREGRRREDRGEDVGKYGV
jgi:hypothetical protein